MADFSSCRISTPGPPAPQGSSGHRGAGPPRGKLFLSLSLSLSPTVAGMNRRKRAERIMRALLEEGFVQAVDRKTLYRVIGRTLDRVDPATKRAWAEFLIDLEWLVEAPGDVLLLKVPASIDIEAYDVGVEEEGRR